MRSALIILMTTLLAFASTAEAKTKRSPHTQQLPELKPIAADYDVYVGGVHLIDGHFVFQQEHARYRVTAHVATHGFWNWAFPWHAEMSTNGRINGARFEPEVHNNTAAWGDVSKTIFMRFDKRRNVTLEFIPYEKPDDNREIVTAEQRRGSLDPLSVIVQLLGDLAVNKSCVATEPAFDGKRRFDLIGEDRGRGDTDPQGYGIYKGGARLCDIHFTMISGKWMDREHSLFWQYMDGDKGHEPFRIWVATLSPELPELAVRAESPSVWGRIVVHLKGWRYAMAEESNGEIK
jgi:hypothetical protein